MSDKPRMLWVARDEDGEIWIYSSRPTLDHGMWYCDGSTRHAEFYDNFPDLQPGECRMFIEFAPRVVKGGVHGESLRWGKNGWVRVPYAMPGDIILPMPPDPTPHLKQVDSSAARREEIRAQIAALQEELDGMGG